MKYTLLFSLLMVQACTMSSPTDNDTAVEQLIEPPNIRTKASISADSAYQGEQMNSNPFQQKQWQLVSYYTPEGMRAVLSDNVATIEFAEKKVSGTTGCNRYFASYQLIDIDTLKISHTGLTMMACPESIAKQERLYLENLPEINFYQFQEEQLILLDAQRQVRLIFQGVPELTLEDVVWQVTGINNGKGGVVSGVQTRKAHLQFIKGKLQGSSGCNSLSASYQTNASELTIGLVGMTRMLCADQSLMLQEQQLTQALAKVKRYAIRNRQLRLEDAKGSLMLNLKQQ